MKIYACNLVSTSFNLLMESTMLNSTFALPRHLIDDLREGNSAVYTEWLTERAFHSPLDIMRSA